jgi:hypothetical protein
MKPFSIPLTLDNAPILVEGYVEGDNDPVIEHVYINVNKGRSVVVLDLNDYLRVKTIYYLTDLVCEQLEGEV